MFVISCDFNVEVAGFLSLLRWLHFEGEEVSPLQRAMQQEA